MKVGCVRWVASLVRCLESMAFGLCRCLLSCPVLESCPMAGAGESTVFQFGYTTHTRLTSVLRFTNDSSTAGFTLHNPGAGGSKNSTQDQKNPNVTSYFDDLVAIKA